MFKVSLSTLQEEDLSRNLKPVKKYGNNVFAPRGNSPKLTEKVIESMPANADPRVKVALFSMFFHFIHMSCQVFSSASRLEELKRAENTFLEIQILMNDPLQKPSMSPNSKYRKS